MIYQCFEGFDKVLALALAPALLALTYTALGSPAKPPSDTI
jgi:hypothetical protein